MTLADDIHDEFAHHHSGLAISQEMIDAAEKDLETLDEAKLAAVLDRLGGETRDKRTAAKVITFAQEVMSVIRGLGIL